MTERVVNRGRLQEACRPVPLADVLSTLVAEHILDAYELTAHTVTLHGDLDAIAVRLEEEDLAPRRYGIFTRRHQGDTTYGFSRCFLDNTLVDHGHIPTRFLRPEEHAAYYQQASQFLYTAAFRTLSSFAKTVWRLHAQGLTNSEIKAELDVPGKHVQVSVRRTRRLARLPEVAGALLSLRGRKKLAKSTCAGPCCKARAVRLGLCNTHYMQMRRRGYLTEAKAI